MSKIDYRLGNDLDLDAVRRHIAAAGREGSVALQLLRGGRRAYTVSLPLTRMPASLGCR